MKKKILSILLMVGILISNFTVFADEKDPYIKGDMGYEDGMYLTEINSISVCYYDRGEAINPYGESLVGKISENEKQRLLSDKKIGSLVDAYNRLYQLLIKYYKFGENNIERWEEVKNLTDPVFGNINKKTWADVYHKVLQTLGNVRFYLYTKGLDEEDFTNKKTYEMTYEKRFKINDDRYKK